MYNEIRRRVINIGVRYVTKMTRAEALPSRNSAPDAILRASFERWH